MMLVYISSILSLVHHPLMLRLVLVLASLITAFYLFKTISVWFFNVLLLVYLGGIMVLFLYITILNNEIKVTQEEQPAFRVRLLVLAVLCGHLVCLKSQWIFIFTPMNEDLGSLYKVRYCRVLLFLIGYLLITLFSSVKFSESFKGRLIKKG